MCVRVNVWVEVCTLLCVCDYRIYVISAVIDVKASSLGPGVNLDQLIGCQTRLSFTPTPVMRRLAGILLLNEPGNYICVYSQKN